MTFPEFTLDPWLAAVLFAVYCVWCFFAGVGITATLYWWTDR